MMLLQTGMAGTFVAFDLVLFFVFWELVLVPMYFMIGIWGGPRREYASVKFFLYTLFGSVFMLVAFLSIYFAAAGLASPTRGTSSSCRRPPASGRATFQTWAFLGIFLGFAIKVPMWPFHTWLPDAHTEAPTVGSVLLAGVLLKMGTYGFIRIALPILPDGAMRFAPIIGVLAVIGIIYGSLCCLAQTDVKRLIAFSSVGHMGFVMLGIASMTETGIQAALYGNIAHGVVTGMLFFLAGSLHERYHTREIADDRRRDARQDAAVRGVAGVRLHGLAGPARAGRVLGRVHRAVGGPVAGRRAGRRTLLRACTWRWSSAARSAPC